MRSIRSCKQATAFVHGCQHFVKTNTLHLTWHRDGQTSLCCVHVLASLVTERLHLGIAYLVMHSGHCGQGACSPAGHPLDRGSSPALRASTWCLPPRCSRRLLHGRGTPTHVYPPFCKRSIYRYPGSAFTALTLCCIQLLGYCHCAWCTAYSHTVPSSW